MENAAFGWRRQILLCSCEFVRDRRGCVFAGANPTQMMCLNRGRPLFRPNKALFVSANPGPEGGLSDRKTLTRLKNGLAHKISFAYARSGIISGISWPFPLSHGLEKSLHPDDLEIKRMSGGTGTRAVSAEDPPHP
jgi:hypothetical protein